MTLSPLGVGGYLADVKHILIINFFKLKMDGLSSEEVAAVITHEIGHAFDGLSAHYKMHTTNSAIMDTLNQLNENKTEKAFYTFKRHFTGKHLRGVNQNKNISPFFHSNPSALAHSESRASPAS